MNFVTFKDSANNERFGVMSGGEILPLDDKTSAKTLLEFIQLGQPATTEALTAFEKSRPADRMLFEDIRLLAPIPKPAKNVFCVGRNYHEHVEEGDRIYGAASGFAGTPEVPIFFTKPATSVVGPGADVIHHASTQRLDYEIELGVVIGRGGVDISETDALSHIWGYTIINDITARDLQDNHKQWFKGKGLDSFCPIGPWIIPSSEIADPHTLDIELTVNGAVRQKANTRQMIFDIRRIIAELSIAMTLEPGDIIATGTCSGCAFAMEPPGWLTPGDVIEAHIEGIGTLRNTVHAPSRVGQ